MQTVAMGQLNALGDLVPWCREDREQIFKLQNPLRYGESYEKLNSGKRKRMSVSYPLSMAVSMSLTVCFVGTPQDCNFLGRS